MSEVATKREEFLKQLLATFRVEGEEHTQKLTEGLLALEENPAQPAEVIESIYREAHSLKGAARAVGLRDVEIICQAIESVFAGFKRGEFKPTGSVIDLLHGANDLVGRLIANEGDAAPADMDLVDRFVKELEKAAAGLEIQAPGEQAHGAPKNDFIVEPQERAKPSEPEAPPATGQPVEPLVPIVPQPLPEESRRVDAERPSPLERSHPSVSPAPQPTTPRAQTIRVNPAQLDKILHQSEELVGVRLTMEHRAKRAAELHGTVYGWCRQWKKLGPACREFKKRLAQELGQETPNSHARLIGELLDWIEGEPSRLAWLENQMRESKFKIDQDRRMLGLLLEGLRGGVRQTLMLPFSHLLATFPKMVRDLARDLNKPVDFSIQGDQVQVDKRILEELKDPLLHLVRNALDHGLERPEDRRRAGKPESGSLRLAIAQIGNGKVEVTLTDDGQGLNPGKLRSEAIKRKLLSAEQAEKLSDEQAICLIFDSGFSTSARVTDLSGRGLGMAIVREKIEALGGELSIENKPGQGATFRMTLPASMATTRGIMVQAGGRLFCIPTSGVECVFRFKRESLKSTQGAPTTIWQGQCVAFIQLEKLLGIPEAPAASSENRHLVALLIGTGGERLALGVECVAGEQEVLVKGFGPRIRRLRNIAGTTVLGTGELVPILHLPDLIQTARHIAGMKSDALSAAETARPAKRVLVADDSITTRTLIKTILEDAGYQVATALDGAQALSMLTQDEFDMLLTDVEMPHMNGFELCHAIRRDSALADLPVILCTSLGSEEDRRRGMDCGASAYIVKRDLEHGQLLDLVAKFV